MTKVIVAGSRDYTNFEKVEYELMMYFKANGLHRADVEIVSGCAKGADTLGIQFAEKYGLKLAKFPADWDQYGKRAGYLRNEQMAKYADVLFAFWDGTSKGTNHMINLARDNNLDVHVIKQTIYTANDEEPDCGQCIHVSNSSHSFCAECGKTGWSHYRRMEDAN